MPDEAANDLSHSLSLASMCEVWLLRAFAESSLASPREGAGPERWLQLLRMNAPRHLAALGANWPELAAFVKLHSL